MTHVVFVNRFFHPDHSATSQLLSDLAFALADGGLDVHIVTSRLRYDGSGGPLQAHERVRGVEIHRVATTSFGRDALIGRVIDYASFYLSAMLALWRLSRPGDLIVAKTDPPLIAIPVRWVALLRSARLVNWVQDLYPEAAQHLGFRVLQGAMGRLLLRLRRATLEDAVATVAVGERMAHLLAHAGAPPASLHVIPNWVDEQTLRPVSPIDNPLRREWGLENRFVVAYSGNLGRAHEYATLLGAAELLKERQDLTFLFIGGGHQTQALAAEVKARGLDHLFMFRPYQPPDRLASSLSAGDVHWISLRPDMEGLIVPSKIYGVFAVGRPVIAVCAPDGEVAAIVARAACGIHVPVGDSDALACAVIRFMADDALRLDYGEAARVYAQDTASRHAAIQRWSTLLVDLNGTVDASPQRGR